MIALAPVTLTGQSQIIDFNAQVQGQEWPIRVANESTYALQVQVGGDLHWLDPGTVDVFQPAYKVTQIKILPTILTGTPSGSVLVTLAEQGEKFTGAYPMALPAQTSITAGTVNIGTVTGNVPVINAGGTQLLTQSNQVELTAAAGVTIAQDGVLHNVGTYTLPVNCHAVELYILPSGAGAISAFHVIGQTSNIDWGTIGINAASPTPNGYIACRVRQAVDASVLVQLRLTNVGGNATVWVVAMQDESMDTIDSSQPGGMLIVGGGLGKVANTDSNGSLFVTKQSAVASAPWEAPNQIPIDFSVQLNASSNAQLIAAPGAGLKLWLHDVQYYYTATSASFGKFRRATGAGTAIASWNSNGAGVFRWGRGAPLGTNEALFVSNDSAVNMAGFFNGTIEYSIG